MKHNNKRSYFFSHQPTVPRVQQIIALYKKHHSRQNIVLEIESITKS